MQKKWLGLAALVPVVALAFMDQTILPVALPTIQQEFNASDIELQWCVNAYLLAIAVFVLVSGKISDQIGHRKMLCLGIAGFALSSALCGASMNAITLIIARGLQGLSGAFMFPAQSALVSHTFPPEKRGQINGIIVSIGAVFLILAPLIGGYLTEVASWRWIFWINLPIAILGIWMIVSFLPAIEPVKKKIDVRGFLCFATGTCALTLFFMQASTWGWHSPPSLLCLALVPLAFWLLYKREKTTEHPFLDLSLFRRPIFTAININIFFTQFILMITVFQTIYFQEILAYTPAETGLITFASGCPVLFMAPIAGFLSDRISPKLPIALGYLSLILSFFWFAFFSTPTLPNLLFALITFGMGIPLILTPSFSTAMAALPPPKMGVAFGMITTLRMLGGTMGLALIHLFVSLVKQSLLPEKGAIASEVGSFSAIHFALAFLLIIAFAITFVFHNRKSAHHLPDSPAEGWD